MISNPKATTKVALSKSRGIWSAARLRACCTTAVFGLMAAPALGTPTFSIDFQGPTASPASGFDTLLGIPIRESDILAPSFGMPPAPGPSAPPGIVIPNLTTIPPRVVPPAVPGLAIASTAAGFSEVDALSYGNDKWLSPGAGQRFFFSVDEFAIGAPGVPGPSVTTEGAVGFGEASADVFLSTVAPGPVPPAPGPGANRDVIDGNGLPPFGGPGVGLLEPNPPSPGFIFPPAFYDLGDNLDALDINTSAADLAGPVYLSLDSAFVDPIEGLPANTGTALANGFVGGDVLVGTPAPGGGPLALYAAAGLLGLDLGGADTDDLDALILAESGDGIYTPSLMPYDWLGGVTDMLLFSVRRGSAVIGALDSIFGIPIEEGDILTAPLMGGVGTPGIFVAAENLGLATIRSGTALVLGDDLDALSVPEPTTLTLFGFGLAALGLIARRRRRAA